MIIRFIQKEPLIWGPIFLLFTLALAAPFAIAYDILLLAASGFFLSSRMQMRGCCYALAFLGIISVIRHAFLVQDHLWALGIEGSLCIAFFITALAFEEKASLIHSLEAQIETRKSAIENLEDELSKAKEAQQDQQILFQEKVALLQKELEEVQTEHSSILILNEVLRKTTARHIRETEEAREKLRQANIEEEQFRKEIDECKAELFILKTSDAWAKNQELMKELNQARYDQEQTHLMNETLTRLHAREIFKAKDAESESASLKEMLQAAHQETQRIQAECNFLKERLDAAMLELESQKPKIDLQIVEKLKFAEEKMLHLSQIEPLFKQLKKQFEEKNQTLHQTRSDLFKADTELQKLKMEKAVLDMAPLPKEVVEELDSLTAQVEVLEEENRELQEIVSSLSQIPPSGKKK